jgi:hypothetical protein
MPAARASELPTLPSLRHLAFDVEVEVKDEYEKRMQTTSRVSSGTGTVRRSAASGTQPVPPDQRTASYDWRSKGRIICDVVAATTDGSLVVDISEESPERSAPRMRVAIGPNGHLNYPPSPPLFDEEVAVLRLLARSVVGSEPHAVGSSWTVQDSGKGYLSKTLFRVVGAGSASDLRLDLDGEYHQEGVDNVSGALQGKLAYDQGRLVPRTASLDAQSRRDTPDGYRVVRMAINLILVDDSFARR